MEIRIKPTAVLRNFLAVILVAAAAFAAPAAMAEGLNKQCLQNVKDICGDAAANACFSSEAVWAKSLPECEGDIQTLIEMANEFDAQNEEDAQATQDPIAPAHGNSDEDTAALDAEAYQSLTSCLQTEAENGADGSACINQTSGLCLERGGDATTASSRQCIQRETAAWDRVLNKDYRSLRDSLDTDAKKVSLRDAQRLWIKFVKSFCPLPYVLNEGTLYLMSSDQCMLDMTARQVLSLKTLGVAGEGN